MLWPVVVWKRDVDGDLIACGGLGERLVELGKQRLRAQLDGEIGRLGPLEWLTVHRARVVDHEHVPGRRRAIDRVEGRESLPQTVELGLDGLVGNLGLDLAHLEPLVLAQLGGRPDRDLDRELELLTLAWQRLDVELRVTDRGDSRIHQSALVPLGQRVSKRLLEDRLPADPLDHQCRRHLSLAESRHPHVAGELPRGALDALLDVVGLDADVHAYARVSKLGDGGPHRRSTLLIAPRTKATPRSARKATKRPTGPVTSHAPSRSRSLTRGKPKGLEPLDPS